MYVRLIRDHEYVADKKRGIHRRIPRGWVGNLDEVLGAAAVKAGAAVDLSPQPEALPAEEVKSAAELLALAETAHFQTFRAEAAKLLGDSTPATKAEIIAALEALPAE